MSAVDSSRQQRFNDLAADFGSGLGDALVVQPGQRHEGVPFRFVEDLVAKSGDGVQHCLRFIEAKLLGNRAQAAAGNRGNGRSRCSRCSARAASLKK